MTDLIAKARQNRHAAVTARAALNRTHARPSLDGFGRSQQDSAMVQPLFAEPSFRSRRAGRVGLAVAA